MSAGSSSRSWLPEPVGGSGWSRRSVLAWSGTPRGRLVLGLLLVAILIGVATVWWRISSREVSDDATVEGPIHPVAPRIDGVVKAVLVDDHQRVDEGEVLVEIDPTAYEVRRAQAAADLAEAVAVAEAADAGVPITSTTTATDLQSAHASADDAKAGVLLSEQQVEASRARGDAAQAEERRAQAEHDRAHKDLERLRPLLEKDEISRQEFDSAEAIERARRAEVETAKAERLASANEVEIAEERLSQAHAMVRRSRAGVEAAGTGPQRVSVIEAQAASARARVEQARAALRQADLQVSYARVRSPSSGQVSRKRVETGQFLRQGQTLLAVVDLSQVWVVARFKETQLERMRVGQEASIRVDAYPGTLRGRVESIGAATTSRFSLLPPQNATGNFVKVVQRVPVKIVIEDEIAPDKPLRPGMSVIAKVYTP